MDVAFKELRLAFQAMDLDGDGQIDREEFTGE
jgi:Ca2+-binding EF-hand superfamily protein